MRTIAVKTPLCDIVAYAAPLKSELMALIRLVCFLKQEVCCLKKKKKKKKTEKKQHGCIISLTTSQRAKVPLQTLQINMERGDAEKVGEEKDRKGEFIKVME